MLLVTEACDWMLLAVEAGDWMLLAVEAGDWMSLAVEACAQIQKCLASAGLNRELN